MARIRTIKPAFFRHEALFDAERETGLPLRIAFAGLWTAADREGRFRWSPRELKLDCLPYDDVDFARVLDALTTRGFIVRYTVHGKEYGHIPSWSVHQVINNREVASEIPEPNEINTLTRAPRVDDACPTPLVHAQGEGKGREREGEEDSEANASGAEAPPDPAVPEREYFMRGREVLGSKSGAMIANLLKAKGRNVALARAALEQASTKQNPMEFIAAICRGPPQARASTVHQQRQAEGRAILDELHEFNTGPSSRTHPGLLRHDPGYGAEGIRGGLGGNLIELSPTRDRSSD